MTAPQLPGNGSAPALSPTERAAERYTDGEWHRLHPATPRSAQPSQPWS